MKANAYIKKPLKVENGIPLFAESGEYVETYQQISSDHIHAIAGGVENPFIDSKVWEEIESNTIQALAEHVKKGDRVLDIGVSTGRLLAHFPEAERYGIDVSLNYLEKLSDSGIEVCMGDVEDLPYADGFFDVIACTDVLEHVLDLYVAAREIARVMAPGGVFVLRVPYKEDLSPYLSESSPYKYVHVRSFDENSIEILFCRQLDLKRERILFDYAMYPDALKGKRFFRGRRALIGLLRRFVTMFPAAKPRVMKTFFHPIEITAVFRAPK